MIGLLNTTLCRTVGTSLVVLKRARARFQSSKSSKHFKFVNARAHNSQKCKMSFPNEESIKAQARIRTAAEEQTNYLSQFSSWTNGIKLRDSALREEAKARQELSHQRHYADQVNTTDNTEVPNQTNDGYGEDVSSIDDAELEERKRGNDFYCKGDFQRAVKCYTQCLVIHPHSEIAFSNRGKSVDLVLLVQT